MSEFTYADGLRALADLLDEHDAIEPYDSHRHLFCVSSPEAMVALVRRLGGRWEKDASPDDYFGMTRDLGGGVTVYVYAPRAAVCERRVVGTRTVERPDPSLLAELPSVMVEEEIVEWVCPDSLLGSAA